MSAKRKYSLTITEDDETEKFTDSKCVCDFCKSIHHSNSEWNIFQPKNQLQKRMKKVVKRLEKTVKKNK
jgi:hypothetical protein